MTRTEAHEIGPPSSRVEARRTEEAARAHHIIWSMRRFRHRSGETVGRKIERVRTLIERHGSSRIIEASAKKIPSRLRAAVFAIATDLVLVDGRLERSERRFLERFAAHLRLSPVTASRMLDVIRIEQPSRSKTWPAINRRRSSALCTRTSSEAASQTTAVTGEVIPSDVPGLTAMAVRQPAGVVLGIAPWNAPVILGTRAVATSQGTNPAAPGRPMPRAPTFQLPRVIARGVPPVAGTTKRWV